MLRSLQATALTILTCASLLIACGKSESTDPNVVVAQTFFDVPICNWLRHGIVYYVVDSDEFFFCNGRELLPVDLSGQDGEDGQDGTSCTVTRDDAAGTTTIRCEDGTEAVVYDGQDGEDGEDGASCVVTETAAGASITCGNDTVTITDGQDGTSCSASTDESGAVTISCDDGSSATIPVGNDGGVTVDLLCRVIGANNLLQPSGLECNPELLCACFTREDVEAAVEAGEVTGCREVTAPARIFPLVVDTLPPTRDLILGGADSSVNPVGDYGVSAGSSAGCFSPFFGDALVSVGLFGFNSCRSIVEEVAGPCDEIRFCDTSADCNDGSSCTQDLCSEGVCSNPRLPDGTACDDGAGQCFLGSCQPVVGGP